MAGFIMSKKIRVFDFFSGCGGTSQGLKTAGCEIVFGLDFDYDSSETFKANNPDAVFINDDIRSVDVADISQLVETAKKDAKILFCGCAPCQPFSKQNQNKTTSDPRRGLLSEFGRFVEFYEPDYVLIENVPGLQKVDVNDGPLYGFISILKNRNYNLVYGVIPALWYGVPQTRERFVLMASLESQIHLPDRTHNGTDIPFATVRDWIGNIPSIEAGESHPLVKDHVSAKLSELNLKRIRCTPEGKGREYWPRELLLECHKKHTGHSDVYGRLAWDKPASGLTTRCISYSNGRFGHPEQDRAISVREAALLQTFPIDYIFKGSMLSKAKQIGNAVPPKMAESIGNVFIKI
ncbi:Modification methylase HgiDII [Klebsiella variicola]|nr:Modification methylase HgiDII [Klebsiella variicola]SXE79265.1 modification methylase [Klebsiella variicola]